MFKWLFIFVAVMVLALPGCVTDRDPRVVKCDSCGKVEGRIGGLLPGQGSRCPCGGRIRVIRHMTQEEWEEAEERGYVTEH